MKEIIDDVRGFVEKALPVIEYGRIVVEIKVSDGKPVAVNGSIHESIKRTKELEDGKEKAV